MNESLEDFPIVYCKEELDGNLDCVTDEAGTFISNDCENATDSIEYIHNEVSPWKFCSGFSGVFSEPLGESPNAENWTDAHN